MEGGRDIVWRAHDTKLKMFAPYVCIFWFYKFVFIWKSSFETCDSPEGLVSTSFRRNSPSYDRLTTIAFWERP